ncbi:hypothetical protein RRG08_012935 [Elysia crispata]|uniref:Uncharacterized protein n=1 Tax=Elysia crispata TaxID=231223 RepID=A0AAE1A1A6_9GAST|nr:hypothetical protein RRG08_012935 [Elysia crispata]
MGENYLQLRPCFVLQIGLERRECRNCVGQKMERIPHICERRTMSECLLPPGYLVHTRRSLKPWNLLFDSPTIPPVLVKGPVIIGIKDEDGDQRPKFISSHLDLTQHPTKTYTHMNSG